MTGEPRAAFVGRRDELALLTDVVRRATRGTGQIVFLEGGLGMGKSVLIRAFRARCSEDPDLAELTFLHGACHETTGQENAYQPFADTLSALAQEEEGGGLGRLAKMFADVAPDWLAIVPVVGAALGAGIKTANLAHEWYFDRRRPDDRADSMAKQYVETITSIAGERPLVLVLEEAQWIDASSCSLLSRLAGAIQGLRVVVLVTYRLDGLAERHPLRDAIHEAVARRGAHQLSLSGFSEADCRDLLLARFGSALDAGFAGWLMQLTGGRPLFLSRYLTELEQGQFICRTEEGWQLEGAIQREEGTWRPTGALADAPEPAGIEALLAQMMDRLLEEDEALLQQGSVQGDTFLSRVLAELADEREIKILGRLRKVAQEHRLIALRHGEGWYQDESDAFQFEHPLLHRAFYDRLTPRERQLYHREIASILEEEFYQNGIGARQLMLEIAHHYASGGKHLEAARFHYEAAQSCLRDGGFSEAVRLCERAIAELDDTGREGPETDELRAKVVLGLLASSFWSGDLERKRALVTLAAQGEAAAERIGATETLAEIRSLKGNFQVQIGDLGSAIDTFRDALELARSTGSPALECVALLYLGGQLAKRDLAEGMRLRREALELFETRVLPTLDQGSMPMERYFQQLLAWLGVGEFDLGNYSEAVHLLSKGIARQRDHGVTEDLVESLNFFAQVTLAIGQFETAEAALREAVAIEEGVDDGGSRPWLGTNLALLGKVHIEAGHVEEAAAPILRGRVLAESSGQRDLVAIVRNNYGEILMQREYSGFDPEGARTCLEENAVDCLEWGMERSAAMAYTLLAALELNAGNVERALDWSARAIALLEERGDMPAARTEEILLNHSRVLDAAGRADEARTYLARARAVIDRKAAAIEEPEYRATFLERVPVSRAIMAATG